jgi:putative ABC transport system permease protein
MSAISQDLHYGFRIFLRNPGFTLIVLISLALGIGANSAIFSLVNAVLMRPLPFHDAEKIVMVWEDASWVGFPENTPAPANYADWKSQNHVFSSMAAMRPESFNLTGSGEPQRLMAYQVTASFFPLLGVRPIHGRFFTESEDTPEANKVVVLTYGFWQSRYAGNKNILGTDIILNNAKHTIIGILPANFQFFSPEISIWAPIAFTTEQLQERNSHNLEVVARIKDGVSFEKAQAEIKTIQKNIGLEYPEETGEGKLGAFIVPIREQLVGDVKRPLILLLFAVAFVLLIACANIANLLLSVAASRKKEIALRAALGANRSRLLRQMITESLVLAAIGGILGLLFAFISFSFLRQMIPAELTLLTNLSIDLKVLLYTLGISLITGVIFGIAPSLQASKTDLNETLKSGGVRTGSTFAATKLRSIMVVAETSLALILLVGAGLLIQTIQKLQTVNVGFQPQNVIRFRTILPTSKYDTHEKRIAFYDEVLNRVKGLSKVQSAGYTTSVPLDWKGGTSGYEWEGKPLARGEILDAAHRQVTSNYLQTMGIQMVEGRYFDGTETTNSMNVAIINEAMTKSYSSDQSPLGKRFKLSGSSRWFTVIGIARNTRNMGLEVETKAEMYFPAAQANFGYTFYAPQDLAIRTAENPINIANDIRQIIRSIDQDLPVSNVMTMNELLRNEFAHRRFTMFLLAAFAALALLLACLGIYGVLSYFVNQQIPEIAVRLALGARPSSILYLVLKRGMGLALIGIAIGALFAFGLARIIQGLLFGVSARDPQTFFSVTIVLLLTALVASLLPALRAMRVNPVTALRYE